LAAALLVTDRLRFESSELADAVEVEPDGKICANIAFRDSKLPNDLQALLAKLPTHQNREVFWKNRDANRKNSEQSAHRRGKSETATSSYAEA
jgi:hypothetical protein